ncbi:NLI interacting factor family phosphatase [Entamoeba histolytica HM-1:IMSS-B]|uniref:protein-serine/threonine phosphatase n=6 Tax=Entamoeba histolytica TaxID=5759 RepID=C4M928_ENTH1|nr:hypothetical protein EHI_121510 [Entamoeba histolytica HM-1:IMSS]EMD45836.1 RNA polymerase II ctd phosphatase, putative [Entamoeba histolytica KU27]EMH77384.1 NLI interacting factor family phosphatase [Entamoeba histolytica HM-1:IMSS-B]EMS16024.1 RNA polymerase II ctd phosphatase [Entamoeba histolytica HM-3:IMSS]ENY65784.1 RNA polymerase II ctd phosphatase, putative [Entamoeba histolytica HM-1:IMSS-A]GAT98142.1 nli interacting factor-like phosphatase domain-containing protein [Entamoeba his|eukprot:XP_648443.1 hypothetical protein EHI_121510 [Entamoeba histolytica HM-1:IMSS]
MSQKDICPHNKINDQNYCVDCYQLIEDVDDYIRTSGGYGITKSYAEEQKRSVSEKLLKEKKLSLILDLDGTIVFTNPELCIPLESEEEPITPEQGFYFEIPEQNAKVFIRFRDGIVTFMEKVSKLYDIHVVTLGQKEYAFAIVNAINKLRNIPFITGDLVTAEDCSSVIVCDEKDTNDGLIDREETNERRSVKRSIPTMGKEEMQVIVDDRIDVWDNKNVVQICEYVPSTNQVDTELVRVTEVLQNIYTKFYDEHIEDVKEILHLFRKKILENKNLYFNRPNFSKMENGLLTQMIWKEILRNSVMMGANIQKFVYLDGPNKTDFIIDAKPMENIIAVKREYLIYSWIFINTLDEKPFEISSESTEYKELSIDCVYDQTKHGSVLDDDPQIKRELDDESSEDYSSNEDDTDPEYLANLELFKQVMGKMK